MIKANSLIITIIISLVIGLICTCLILLAWFNRSAEIVHKINRQLGVNLSSGINIVLQDTAAFSTAQTDSIDLFDTGNDSIIITKECWGLFNIASVVAKKATWAREKNFLYGGSLPSFMDACIYMADHKRPLSLVGSVILQGNAYLSKAGIKPSYIDQRGFSGSRLLQGDIKPSNDELPPFCTVRFDYLQQLLNKCTHPAVEDRAFFEIPDSLDRSFGDSAAFISYNGLVDLSGITLSGHITILSDTCIEVDASSNLNNVLLVAPIIRIKSGFSGCLQLIASRSIQIEKDCTLSYPSSLVLIKELSPLNPCTINIDSASKLCGIIFTYAFPDDVAKTMVTLKKGAYIEGLVYVSGFLEMNATVHGTVATDYFLYRSNAMMYENYLADVEISRIKLFPFFVNSPLFTGFTVNRIIQWVK